MQISKYLPKKVLGGISKNKNNLKKLPASVHGVISFGRLLQNSHSTISKKTMFRS